MPHRTELKVKPDAAFQFHCRLLIENVMYAQFSSTRSKKAVHLQTILKL